MAASVAAGGLTDIASVTVGDLTDAVPVIISVSTVVASDPRLRLFKERCV